MCPNGSSVYNNHVQPFWLSLAFGNRKRRFPRGFLIPANRPWKNGRGLLNRRWSVGFERKCTWYKKAIVIHIQPSFTCILSCKEKQISSLKKMNKVRKYVCKDNILCNNNMILVRGCCIENESVCKQIAINLAKRSFTIHFLTTDGQNFHF